MDDNSRSEEEEENRVAVLPSSSRQQRNQAEKQRRDKLNQYINELAILVPMVSTSARKLDKTSILRLSATFLRMHRVLVGTTKSPKVKDLGIPMEWCQQLLDGLEGMLLVVSSSGKIVFVSYNVESILGHHQNDLLGEYLREFTHPDDHDELLRNLKFSDGHDGTLMNMNGEDSRRPERRSFFLRLKQRPASRSDQPQYEVLHFEGHLRTPKQQNGGSNKNRGEGAINTNETVLVALVRPYKERNVTDNSLLEATKEEWVTRHLIDGTIIFSDHRISFLSGYLAEEVTGSPAFKYMHEDDVRWVMIALRQMYCKSESYGWSCYRLRSKNGEYIYLRTTGFLENDDNGQVLSFICINTLVTNQEGKKCIAEMKRMFTPMVGKRSEPLIPAVVDGRTNENTDPCTSEDVPPLQVENNGELELAIELLLSDLPPLGIRHKTTHAYSMKANTLSKTLPPVEVQRRQVGAKLPILQTKYSRPSVITSVSANGDRQKRSQDSLEEAEVKRLRGNRSVIVSDTRSHIDNYAVDNNFIFNADLLLDTPSSSFSQFPENTTENSTYLRENISNQLLDFLTNGTEDDDALRIPVDITSSDIWDTPVSDLEEGVLRGHIHLENKIQSQGVQIQEIEEDLQTVPLTGSQVYQSHFTHLKAEHRKQQELLKTLQQDHQRQQTKEQISMRGTEQNIGV